MGITLTIRKGSCFSTIYIIFMHTFMRGTKKLEMSLANIGFSVERGESIAKEGNYTLEKEIIKL